MDNKELWERAHESGYDFFSREGEWKYLTFYAYYFINKIVLEIGCGDGANILRYGKIARRIDGVDISETAIQKAKMKCPNSLFWETDGFHLPEFDYKYDVIFSIIAFQHMSVECSESYIRDSFRALRIGGHIIIQVAYNKEEVDPHYLARTYPIKGLTYDETVLLHGEQTFWGIDEFKRLLTNNGFEVIKVDTYPNVSSLIGWHFFVAKKPTRKKAKGIKKFLVRYGVIK